MIRTSAVLQHFKTATATAAFFGIKPQAISQWGDTIPYVREIELRVKLPLIFGAAAHAVKRNQRR